MILEKVWYYIYKEQRVKCIFAIFFVRYRKEIPRFLGMTGCGRNRVTEKRVFAHCTLYMYWNAGG